MRQVPHYLIIGNGRMATHFCHYLQLLHIPYTQWFRKQSSQRLIERLSTATHIIVLIKDDAISDFVDNLAIKNKTFVHFSGRLSLKNCYSAHPLMTFTPVLYDLQKYQSIPFITEQNGPAFSELLPGIPNQAYAIPSELKNYYHAMCVISGNFSCILWQKLFHELQHTFNLPPEIAKPYLQQSFENIANNPFASLTGPLARKDHTTIQENLNSLENDPFLAVYQAFIKVFEEIKDSKNK
jgi:predicted short-subunit dehydrogenase-like oxidoreductase (DUF2520 family)